MSYLDDAVAATMQWEGSIPWMYLDTKGNVTVGCGQLITDPGAACVIPFQYQSGGAAAEVDVARDFRRAKALVAGKKAGFYHADTSPILTPSTMAYLLRTTMGANDATLNEAFSGWGSFPASAKLALLDMEYNVGEGELLRGYPLMDTAIREQNWTAAATQCGRTGISAVRNDWTKQMFLNAASGS